MRHASELSMEPADLCTWECSFRGTNFHNINGITTFNQGFEVSLNTTIFKRREGFNWNLSANWSTYRETLKRNCRWL